ncbi:hypothetical protein BSKO_01119 [Bryopsis sp. KO-2023]|nr:hypothetical protein BSKO_01119 [Bryopsis sp. KO-2023]
MMRFWLAGVVAAVSTALLFEGALCRLRSGEPCSTFYMDRYYTPRFIDAAAANDLECMKEFRAAGDDINAGTKFETMAIEELCYDTYLEGLKLMISWGAKFYRALDQSVCRGQPQCVKVLLEAGATWGREAEIPCSCIQYDCDDNTKKIIKDLLDGGTGGGDGSGYSCGVLYDTDFPSSFGILNDGKQDITDTNGECCALCTSNPWCESWTRIKSDTEYNSEGECWLRNYVPTGVRNDNTDSGHKARIPKQSNFAPDDVSEGSAAGRSAAASHVQ